MLEATIASTYSEYNKGCAVEREGMVLWSMDRCFRAVKLGAKIFLLGLL